MVVKLLPIQDLLRIEHLNADMFRLVQSALKVRTEITGDDIPGHITLYSDEDNQKSIPFSSTDLRGRVGGLRLLTRCTKLKLIDVPLVCSDNRFELMTKVAKSCPNIEKFTTFTRKTSQILLHYVRALDGKVKVRTISYKFDLEEAIKDRSSFVRNHLLKFRNDIFEAIKLCPSVDELELTFNCSAAYDLGLIPVFKEVIHGVIRSKQVMNMVLGGDAALMFLFEAGWKSTLKSITLCIPLTFELKTYAVAIPNRNPDIEKFHIRSVDSTFLHGMVNWTRLVDLQIVIGFIPFKKNKFKDDFEFFLRNRGQQLKRLSIELTSNCPLINLTDQVLNYCPSLIDFSVSGAKLDIKRLGPLTQLRILNVFVTKDYDLNDFDTLLESNHELRFLTIEPHDKETLSKVETFLKATKIIREHNYLRLRVKLTSVTKDGILLQ